ncbi:DUF4355 domain-containing protein [Crossiella sp. CA-258035]|uniref:DUF4355 domain-containing protein n=1 Tax=Crossiella sp. CA-258035 TaxID=2981138 RepID=UPI0024BCC2A0|nr:DUF4355 domain-containing protein [Crossiella sp. CA-258035]WHT21015.1 DUF4355 domain-containing protein [Crossiella sp. CA-258035]
MRNTILPTHPTLHDPVTGKPLQAIGVGKDGKIWWPVLGGNGAGDPQPTPPADPAPPANEPLGDAGKAALDAERKRAKEAEKRAKELEDRLKEIEDKDKSELEKAQSRLAELEQASSSAEAKLRRYEIAAKHSIPADYMDLLTGSDVDTLESQAAKIATLVKANTEAQKLPAFAANPGQGTPPATTSKPDVEAGRRLYQERNPKKT